MAAFFLREDETNEGRGEKVKRGKGEEGRARQDFFNRFSPFPLFPFSPLLLGDG